MSQVQLVIIDEVPEWESNVVKMKRRVQKASTHNEMRNPGRGNSPRMKRAITAANNAVKRAKVKQKNRAKNRVARKSRRVNRHKR